MPYSAILETTFKIAMDGLSKLRPFVLLEISDSSGGWNSSEAAFSISDPCESGWQSCETSKGSGIQFSNGFIRAGASSEAMLRQPSEPQLASRLQRNTLVIVKDGGVMTNKFTIRLVFVLSLAIFLLSPQRFRIALFAAEPEGRKSLKPQEVAQIAAKVLPKEGYRLKIKWGELGPTLVKLGVIDLVKFRQLYRNDRDSPAYLRYLEAPSNDVITVTVENAPFLVNVFSAFGLANKNPLLEKLAMERPEHELMRLASTGGWTLGTKPPTEFYSNFDIVRLTPQQQKLVADLAGNIYRPCCNNATSFPDCNHGIALLGLIELMAANGFGREQILTAALQFNAFWFPQHYVKTALVFHLRGIDWKKVDPQEVLGFRYSSSSGWSQHVDAELQKISSPLPPQGGGSAC